ncbi:family 78 glycoside hydrolase catalytic domain [soil metagenome]
MLRSLAVGLAFGLPLSALAMTPAKLRCEYLMNPLGIGETKPRLSWIVESPVRGDVQTAYRVRVASSPKMLAKGQGDLWDSGAVASGETVGVEYGGKPLGSRQQAWWTVTVWDGDGQAKTSAPASWEMGLLNRSDWSASWIGMARPSVPKADVSWIWTDEGGPKQDAPAGDRYFRTFIEGESGTLGVAVDNSFVAMLNDGETISQGTGWNGYTKVDLKPFLKPGRNELVIRANNESKGFAGLAVLGETTVGGVSKPFASSDAWESSVDGKTWKPAKAWMKMGGEPYGKVSWEDSQSPPYLRRMFDVKRGVKRARVYATAKGVYRLMLDGKTVGKGLFNPGWTDYRKRIQYQTYDVTKMLRAGKHTVGMLVGDGWYAGHVGWGEQREHYGDHPSGLAQLEIEYNDGTTERVASDGEWQAANGAILSSDFLQGEVYDARKELGAWSTPNATGGEWSAPDVAAIGPKDNLVAQKGPEVERFTELKPKTRTEPTPGTYIFDLGQNMVGWARLRMRGTAGQKVQLRFGEMLNPDGTLYTTNLRLARATDTYIAKGGSETFEPTFTFHGFRYVEVTGMKPGKDDVTGVVVTSATPRTGTFACSNPLVNQLQSNIEWGQRGNYIDIPTDCPQRDERLGWMGDAQVFARTATSNADVAAFLTKWLDDVSDAQSDQGGFSDVSPRMVDLGDGAPGWGDAGVIVPWTVYQAYGDRRILERKFDSMKAWVDYIARENPDGLWTNRRNNDFGDWLNVQTEPPRELLATAYYAHSTDLVAQSARVLGKREEAERYGALFEKIKAAFNAKWVTEDGHIADETQTAYLLALGFNLLPEEKRAMAAKYLVTNIESRGNHLSTGFLGVSYLNPVLTSVGRSDIAYKLLQNDTYPSWGYSIRQGATTIWERWDGYTKEKGFQDPGMNSFNHYSLGSVGQWMMGTVAGIDMAKPGYQEIAIRPEPGGGMTWAKASYDSIRGRIASSWKQEGPLLTLDVTIPANTLARIYVPTVDLDTVRESNTFATLAPNVRFLRIEKGKAVFEVGGGKYRFTSVALQG